MPLKELRKRACAAGIHEEAFPEDCAETAEKMYLSIGVRGGLYRFKSGHNGGLLIGEFGLNGRTAYQRDRGHSFAALAQAREGEVLKPGRYRAGENDQWQLTLGPSGQITITFFAAHKFKDGQPRADHHWADPEQNFLSTNGSVRQAGQLLLRPDGGFHSPQGNSVQSLTHGVVASTGQDLTRYDSAEQRKIRFKGHQHHGGVTPYFTQGSLDRSLVDPGAPGTRLLHTPHEGARMLDSALGKVRVKKTAAEKYQPPPWALHDDVCDASLAQAWATATGGDYSAERKNRNRVEGKGLLPARSAREQIPGAFPLWAR